MVWMAAGLRAELWTGAGQLAKQGAFEHLISVMVELTVSISARWEAPSAPMLFSLRLRAVLWHRETGRHKGDAGLARAAARTSAT